MAREPDDPAVAKEGSRGRIVWAKDERGRMPAREFYQKLSPSDKAKFLALFRRFTDLGAVPQNKEKFRQLKGEDLFEFKIWGVRLLGRFVASDTFMIAHGVKKKSDKLRPSEFAKARRILEIGALECMEANGNEH